MKRTFPLLSLLLAFITIFAQSARAQDWKFDYQSALREAKNNNKLVLLNFSGSDWCGPCIQMKKQIFAHPDFVAFARQHLVLLNADFPRYKKNKLSSEQQAKNNALAEKFNQKGNFPKTVLIDQKGKVLKEWIGYKPTSPTVYINEIKQHFGALKAHRLMEYSEPRLLMGSRFSITVVCKDEIKGEELVEAAYAKISDIERLISSWDENSQTSLVNQNAGIAPVKVDRELFELIKRSKMISDLTQGAFDISFGSIHKGVWKFDGQMEKWPDSATVRKSIGLINYKRILLDEEQQTVFLMDSGMRIGFGAIGKGFAAREASKYLKKNGVKGGVVNAGGDLYCWGTQAAGQPWTIAIADPDAKDRAFSELEVQNMAVVTSGNYEKFIEFEGKQYCHILDPRTGYPVQQLKSVTIICEDPELADALATSVFVLGPEIGLDLINQMKGVECIVVTETGDILKSKKIEFN